jgi:hypothetical protein
VQRIDLRATLSVILEAHPHRQGEEVGEAFLERVAARDLAADIADHAAEPSAQEPQLAPGTLELMGMGVPADHDRGTLGNAPVALP